VRTSLDCLPCLVRQALDSGRLASPDPAVSEQLVRDVLARLAESDLRLSPPALAQVIHRRLRELIGVDDVYRPAKERLNRVALGLREELETALAAAEDPFDLAVRLAIAGNVIDLGVSGDVSESDVRQSVEQALREPVRGRVDDLCRSVERAGRILYLADNAGELVFDRLLIGQIGPERVTLAVRGAPVLNDATLEDARAAGLTVSSRSSTTVRMRRAPSSRTAARRFAAGSPRPTWSSPRARATSSRSSMSPRRSTSCSR